MLNLASINSKKWLRNLQLSIQTESGHIILQRRKGRTENQLINQAIKVSIKNKPFCVKLPNIYCNWPFLGPSC